MSDAPTILDLPPAPPHLANDPVLRRAKEGLRRIYGERLAGVVLYGSRARGDQRPDSDYDILVLLKDHGREHKPSHRLNELALELFDFGPPEVEVNFLPLDEDALARRTIFTHNVREEGFRL
ncbi:MAG TPA: nucleotidyltransferase domain-containing protein [Rhizomicrobium sp.]|jgi:predicted nucleotidyltransferase